MPRYPLAFGHALSGSDFLVHGAVELAIAGDPRSGDFRALERVVSQTYVPSLVMAGGPAGGSDDIALLAQRGARGGNATAYVCRGHACDQPTTDPRELWDQLSRATRSAAHP